MIVGKIYIIWKVLNIIWKLFGNCDKTKKITSKTIKKKQKYPKNWKKKLSIKKIGNPVFKYLGQNPGKYWDKNHIYNYFKCKPVCNR